MKLFDVIDALVEEKGLNKDVLAGIVCEGMCAAYEKRYPMLKFRVDIQKKLGEMVVESQREVVGSVVDEMAQISLRRARGYDDNVSVGDLIWVPFEEKIGRIEILKAKQVISQKIKDIEASAVYAEFKAREGTVLQGVVHKIEQSGITIKVDDYLAFLPKSLSVPGEKYSAGFPIKALLKEVLIQPKNENQLILDRVSSVFIERLFELEIPEVFEKLVEIKKIVRIAGYKTKVAVISHDSNIDPVGTCVGVGGARIKPILKELGSEKIDIIFWTENLDVFVKNSLKPAEINRVSFSDDGRSALIWLDDDQRSLAIGRLGQNIALASELTEINIDLIQIKKDNADNLDKKLREEF